MITQCPHCGKPVPVYGIGSRPLGVDVKIVCGALKWHPTIQAAALSLGCSRSYIYKSLKLVGLTIKEAKC